MRKEVKLGDILDYEQPNSYIVRNSNYDKKFVTPVLTAGQSFILGYTNEKENIFKAKENPVIIFDDFTTASKYVDFDFKVKSSAMKILKPKEGINIKYVYYAMQNIKFDNQLHKRYWISEYSKIKLLIPDIKIQEKIVKELDLINKLLDYKKKQIELFDDFIKSQFVEMFDLEKYKSEELGKICDVRDGTHDSPKYIEKSDYKLITSKNINKEGIDFSDVKYITKKDYDKINIRSNVSYGDILMPMIGTIGNPVIVKVQEEKIDFTIKNLALIKFFNKTVVINKYIKYLVDSEWFENEVLKNSRGGTQKFLSLKDIRKMKIPLPPIDLQNQFSEIVKQIDKQKFEIEKSLKETQELYESLMEKYFG